jgi:hypothetical protein
MSETNTLQDALDATFAVAVDWIATIDENLSRNQVKRQMPRRRARTTRAHHLKVMGSIPA